MIQHFFKLIWNQRRQHLLLIIEMCAAFLVLFGVLSLIVYQSKNLLSPRGYSYEQTWRLQTLWSGRLDSLQTLEMEKISQRLRQYPEVAAVSLVSGNTPFSMNSHISDAQANNRSIGNVNVLQVDADFARVLELKLLRGQWFTSADNTPQGKAVIINRELSEQLFSSIDVLGKKINWAGQPRRIIGVVEGFKPKGETQPPTAVLFSPYRTDRGIITTLLVRVKAQIGADFESRMIKDLGHQYPGTGFEVSYLTDQRRFQHQLILVPIILLALVSGFLLFNVALGLLGMLTLSIGRRRAEIGLRRALGATQQQVKFLFRGEMLAMASLAMVAGSLVAVQFPLLRVFQVPADVYLVAMGLAVLLTYLMVGLCAWYPSQQAAGVPPAQVLHEN